jgi:hypothetical protein
VVPAVNPGIGLIKINMRSDLVFSGGRNRVRTCDFSLVRRVFAVARRSPLELDKASSCDDSG